MPDILLCNDHRKSHPFNHTTPDQLHLMSQSDREALRIRLSEESNFAKCLQRIGYRVMLFDGWDRDLVTQLDDPIEGADYIERLISEHDFHPEGVLYDIQYWEQEDYGLEMMDLFVQRGFRSILDSRIVMLSIRKNQPNLSERELRKRYPFIQGVEQRLSCSRRKLVSMVTGLSLNAPQLRMFTDRIES